MSLTTSIVTGTAALALVGGVYAVQASADPTTAAPSPTATASADLTRGAGVAWFYGALTDVQRHCLADANLHRPEGRLTDDQAAQLRQQVRSALASCEVNVPPRVGDRARLGFRWAALTSDQQNCLAEVSLTRPVGRLTEAERATVRQSLRDAVTACGVS